MSESISEFRKIIIKNFNSGKLRDFAMTNSVFDLKLNDWINRPSGAAFGDYKTPRDFLTKSRRKDKDEFAVKTFMCLQNNKLTASKLNGVENE